MNAPVEPHEFRASVGRSWRGNGADGEPDGVTRSGTGEHRQTARRPTDSNDELSHRGTTPRAAQGSAPRTLPVSDRQLTGRRLSNRAEVTSAGRHWRDFDSNGHGKERPAGRREGVGGAKRTMEEGEQEEDDDDATELLLDLSDCSDEVGRRRKGEKGGAVGVVLHPTYGSCPVACVVPTENKNTFSGPSHTLGVADDFMLPCLRTTPQAILLSVLQV